MKTFMITVKTEVVRYVEAETEEEAMDKVDGEDMIHELKNYNPDLEWDVEELNW